MAGMPWLWTLADHHAEGSSVSNTMRWTKRQDTQAGTAMCSPKTGGFYESRRLSNEQDPILRASVYGYRYEQKGHPAQRPESSRPLRPRKRWLQDLLEYCIHMENHSVKIGDLVRRNQNFYDHGLNQLALVVDYHGINNWMKVEWIGGGWSYEDPNSLEIVLDNNQE
tara:strand:- start:1132 stop:1632 length:501 start_codon:yes stop_codon:yes gene_type:complete